MAKEPVENPEEETEEDVQQEQPLEWDGERLDVSDALRERGAAYGMYVNTMRALPDIRDGLKSVQRRVIYSMAENNQVFSRGTTKCARIVGSVMGKYHPHGDTSIYDALVRLGQPFTVNVTLITPQGNFGSVDGDPSAAMRYCLSGDTRVEMADGRTVRIADLAKGMSPDSEQDTSLNVLNRLAKPVHASKIFHSGDHPTLKIRTREGYSLTGSENHPVLCIVEDHGVPLLLWKLMEEIEPGDRVLISRSTRQSKGRARQSDLETALLLGAWVSEGHFSAGRAGFNNTDKNYFDAVVDAYAKHVGGAYYTNERNLPSGKPLYELDIHNTSALQESVLGPEMGNRSAFKRIPEWVWQQNLRTKQRFLQSLYCGDGSCSLLPRSTVQIAYCSQSIELLEDVQKLLLQFGVISKISSANTRTEHKLVITNRRDARLFAKHVGFWGEKQDKLKTILSGLPTNSRSLSHDFVPYLAEFVRSEHPGDQWLSTHNIDRIERWEGNGVAIRERITDQLTLRTIEPLVTGDYYYAEVQSVEEAGVQAVYSLRVDSEDHAFLTDGFVSHNTEAKLSQAASAWRSDIRPEIVSYRPNFDESTTEPSVLPVDFPVLLVNGSQGIGWSLACDVPPHNLAETIDAVLYLADHPKANLSQIMRRLPGPDYPSCGSVANPHVLEDAYASGRGSFTLQGKWHIEGNSVMITELPYQIGPSQIFQEIIDAAKNEKITELTEKPVNLSGKKGIKLVVKCKRGGNPQALVAQLLKYTSLQTTQKVNFTVLRDGTPATVGLLSLLQAFLDFRKEVVVKRLEHERSVLIKELRRLTALRAALDVIEKVIKIIREAKNDEDARGKLKALVKVVPYGEKKAVAIDDEQAEHILSMQLRRLNQLNRFQLDEEIKTKSERVAEIDIILASEEKILEIVKNELKAVKKEFGIERRTMLSGAAVSGSDGDAVAPSGPKQDIELWVSKDAQAIALERPGKAAKKIPLNIPAADLPVARIECDTESQILLFTASGLCYRVRAGEIGVDQARGKGRAFCALGKGDRLVAAYAAEDAKTVALVTDDGQIKRVGEEVLAQAHAGGYEVIGLKSGKVLAALAHGEGQELLVHSASGRVLRTALDPVRVVKGGGAGPVALMKLPEGDRLVSAGIADGDHLMVVHENGMGKVVPLAEYPAKGRGGGGVASASTDKPAREPAGPVAGAWIIRGDEAIMVGRDGSRSDLIVSELPAGMRATVSKAMLDSVPALILARNS